MLQLERQRVFQNSLTGKWSLRFLDVCSGTMHLDDRMTEQWRLFQEIDVVPFAQTVTESERELYALPAATRQETAGQFYSRFLETLGQVVEQGWAPDKFHLVLHSSGYDSRILSATIRNIWRRRGDGWLGRVLFACYGGECASFVQAMRHTGWDETQYVALDIQLLYELALTLTHAAHACNGAVRSPFNSLWTVPAFLQQMGIVPAEVQMWLGWGTDYAMVGAGHPSGNCLRQRQEASYAQPTSIACCKVGDVAYPFQSHDVLRTCIESTVRDVYGRRPEILAYLDPELAAIPRIQAKLPPMDDRIWRRVVNEYCDSWYGFKMGPLALETATRDVNEYSRWWQHWSAAAIIEHLRETGVKVE